MLSNTKNNSKYCLVNLELPVSDFNQSERSWDVKEVSPEKIRSLFFGFKFGSIEDILAALLYGFERDYPVTLKDPPPS